MNIEYRFTTREEFNPIIEQWRQVAFADNHDIELEKFYTEEAMYKRKALGEMVKLGYRLYLLAYVDGKLAGWSWGYQKSSTEFYMCNSAVLPEFRRKGIYKHMLETVLEKASQDGFQEITSKHHACNNEVLLPKMRKGFMISGFEINPRFGTLVTLVYFPNKQVEHVYQQRIGFKK